MTTDRRWGIVKAAFPRSFVLAVLAVPATYALATLAVIDLFPLLWGMMLGLTLAAIIYNINDVVSDVRALVITETTDHALTRTARIALRRTLAPLVLIVSMGLWALDTTLTGALGGLRFTSEWLLYYLVAVIGICNWYDVFDRYKLLNRRHLALVSKEGDCGREA